MAALPLAEVVDDHGEASLVAFVAGRELPSHREIAEAVLLLHRRHPVWSLRQIAESLRLGKTTVARILDAAEVRAVRIPWADALSDSSLAAIHAAPRECWSELVFAAAKFGWSREEISKAIPPGLNEPDALRCECGLPLNYIGHQDGPRFEHAIEFDPRIGHKCDEPRPRRAVEVTA